MFFLLLRYGISTTLLQILLHDFLFIQSKVFWKKAIWTFGSIRPGVLKNNCSENFKHNLHTFQQNIHGWVYFKYTCRSYWDYSKKLFRAAILQTGIYPSNLDVRYLVQKTQSFNWVLKLNLNVYISVCLFVVTF